MWWFTGNIRIVFQLSEFLILYSVTCEIVFQWIILVLRPLDQLWLWIITFIHQISRSFSYRIFNTFKHFKVVSKRYKYVITAYTSLCCVCNNKNYHCRSLCIVFKLINNRASSWSHSWVENTITIDASSFQTNCVGGCFLKQLYLISA